MDYNININKICRVCLEEGVLTSIFNTEFAMQPAEMIALCARIRVYRDDGLPPVICNNCIYRLGAAYHFKQQCENSDLRLRSYLGMLEKGFSTRDNETNTEPIVPSSTSSQLATLPPPRPGSKRIVHSSSLLSDWSSSDSDTTSAQLHITAAAEKSRKSRYVRKTPAERKKRGPKPQPTRPPATCYECHKTFKCPAQLQLHIRTHTGDRPFACAHCPRRFAQKHNLAIHVRTHTGERPFQCEICSRQFAALGNFQAHKKIHTGVRDQLCPVCQKAFVTAGDLARHMQTHTGLKPHHCDVCGKAFTRNRDMQAHKRKQHTLPDNRSVNNHTNNAEESATAAQFKCRQCHKRFDTAVSLGAHERSSHDPLQVDSTALMMTTSLPTPLQPTAVLSGSTTINNGSSNVVDIGMHEIDVGTQQHQQQLHQPTSSSVHAMQPHHHLHQHHMHHHQTTAPLTSISCGNDPTIMHHHLNHHHTAAVQHVGHPHLNHVAASMTHHPMQHHPHPHHHHPHLPTPATQRLHPF